VADGLANLGYLAAAVLFITGLKGLTHPKTAVRGNLLGALGMLAAVVTVLLDRQIVGYKLIVAGLAVGSISGAWLALRVQMTAMPQMVALLNGFGGIASVLVVGTALLETPEYLRGLPDFADPLGRESTPVSELIAAALSVLIGAVTFCGSLVAYLKLEDRISDRGLRLGNPYAVHGALGLVSAALAGWLVASPPGLAAGLLLALVASLWGVLLVINIGGADMPVVIALLNSYSGLAAAATGFVLGNNSVLIIAGSLVGASGIILTRIMCQAMNRSLLNVIFGGILTAAAKKDAGQDVYARVKSASPEDVAIMLDSAQSVVIVPGYGMAVSQAQHAVSDLSGQLEARGATVEFGIHPVAGRMPGHMNVLLAEAGIPYEKLREMEQINLTIAQADVVLVIGANDVVNPLARTDPQSPIAGMPIIDCDKARSVVIIKRSLSPGFAGIPNPLFAADNAVLLFSDGKQAVLDIITALKEL
jgi:H+-translocating NAD(P) transhydrogenase subunit beta